MQRTIQRWKEVSRDGAEAKGSTVLYRPPSRDITMFRLYI